MYGLVEDQAKPTHLIFPHLHCQHRSLYPNRYILEHASYLPICPSGAFARFLTCLPSLTLPSQAGIAACWNFIESISLCSHRDHRGFHPVICIVIDLLLWFGFTTSSVLMGVLGIEEDADYSGWYLNPEEADDFYYAALGMGILEMLVIRLHVSLLSRYY